MADRIERVIALGASNLTRGFHTLVSTARAAWGPDVQVFVALGHGRSYGAPSRIAVRTLPGILQSDLWEQLASLPRVRTRGLVTDVGNDILYGYSAAQTLAWVEESLSRVQEHTADVAMTDLPLDSIRRLSSAKFFVMRSLLYPPSRLTFAEVLDTAERVNDGLAAMADRRGLRLVRLAPEWYGLDPIHIRPALWEHAWREILCGNQPVAHVRGPWYEGIRLYLLRPQRQWLFGREQVSPQSGVALALGGRVWLY